MRCAHKRKVPHHRVQWRIQQTGKQRVFDPPGFLVYFYAEFRAEVLSIVYLHPDPTDIHPVKI